MDFKLQTLSLMKLMLLVSIMMASSSSLGNDVSFSGAILDLLNIRLDYLLSDHSLGLDKLLSPMPCWKHRESVEVQPPYLQ